MKNKDLAIHFEKAVEEAKKAGLDIHNLPGQWHDVFKGSKQLAIPYEPEIRKPAKSFLTKDELDRRSKRVEEFVKTGR